MRANMFVFSLRYHHSPSHSPLHISRSFFNAVVVLTHSYPTAVVTALAAPALRRPDAGSAQSEMVSAAV